MLTVLLLIASNVFMTVAWYGHLKHRETPLFQAIVVSWLIAFGEYCLQVPANRMGYTTFNAYQLKIIQEVITLLVFVGFATFYLREQLRWNHIAAGVCLVGAVWFVFLTPKAPARTRAAETHPATLSRSFQSETPRSQ